MGDIERILDIVDPRFSVKPANGEAVLEEHDENAHLKTIRVTGLPAKTCILKLEGQVGRFLKKGSKERKCCDYIIIATLGDRRHLVFIELKSQLPRGEKRGLVKWQLKGGECAIDYLDSILRVFHKNGDSLDSFERRYFVVHATPVNKQGRPQTFPRNDAENPHFLTMSRRSDNRIPFARFVT